MSGRAKELRHAQWRGDVPVSLCQDLLTDPFLSSRTDLGNTPFRFDPFFSSNILAG
jgi:hypothetical protein